MVSLHFYDMFTQNSFFLYNNRLLFAIYIYDVYFVCCCFDSVVFFYFPSHIRSQIQKPNNFALEFLMWNNNNCARLWSFFHEGVVCVCFCVCVYKTIKKKKIFLINLLRISYYNNYFKWTRLTTTVCVCMSDSLLMCVCVCGNL